MAAPILSMTGFGSAQLERDGSVVRAEIRTVNHKHLQVRMRLPNGQQSLEPEIEGRVKKVLQRGSVQVSVNLDTTEAAPNIELQTKLAEQYAKSLRALAESLNLDGDLSVAHIAGLPGVLHIRDDVLDPDVLREGIAAAVDAALEDLLEMRSTEGAAMVVDLRLRGREIAALQGKIAARTPGVVQEHQTKLRERVANLLQGQEGPSEQDLAREIAILADRLDISEELARLQAHLDQLESLLAAGGSIGRKLDFLCQEFMREANTIGSKCSDAETAHQVVELKAAIERLREQVQNIE